MINFNEIEVKILSYQMANGNKSPRYVLMDEKTFEDFAKSFAPKTKFALPSVDSKDAKVAKFHSAHNCIVDVLSVQSDYTIFDVAG